MAEVPNAGDDFYAVADERMARELAEQRKQEKKDALNAPLAKKVSLDDLFSQIQEGEDEGSEHHRQGRRPRLCGSGEADRWRRSPTRKFGSRSSTAA